MKRKWINISYKGCPCVISVGNNTCHVSLDCPHFGFVRGDAVVTKMQCRDCERKKVSE